MFSERFKIVPIAKEIDLSGTVYSDSINMANFHKAALLFICNTLGGGTSVLTICSGVTVAACTTALTFNYAFGGAAVLTATAGSSVSADVLAAWTSAASCSLTYGSYSNYMLVCEVDTRIMDIANGHKWLTAKFTTTASVTGTVSGFAILEPRYTSNRSVTCLA
jgi:hypothetical protein